VTYLTDVSDRYIETIRSPVVLVK